MKREKVYISGPVSGMPELNHPAFRRVEKMLFAADCEVENPINNQRPLFFDLKEDAMELWQYQMRKAVSQLTLCDSIVMLNGWEKSKGATIELWLAHMLGLVLYNENLQPLNIAPEEISLPDWQAVKRHLASI